MSYQHENSPIFGSGRFQRRIRLQHKPGEVYAELEDCSHGFTVRLAYSDTMVSKVEAQALRYPLTTCPGATEPLQAFVGLSVEAPATELTQNVNARHNCTHLFDLCVLAFCHARRPYGVREYDVIIPDEVDAPTSLTVLRDGEAVLDWQVREWKLTGPDALAGKTLHAGFSNWLNAHAQGDEEQVEYGQIAQKGYLVSHARRYDADLVANQPIKVLPGMDGICHSYTRGRIETARHTASSFRDFTDCEEQLLRFT